MSFFDKLTGKAKRDEQARLEQERIAQEEREAKERAEKEQALKEERAAKRAEKKAKKLAEEQAKKASPKEIATANKEPWVQVLNVELDPNNPGAGAFELDWNDIFVARLIKSGYQGKTDADIVDNWFTDLCRHIALETYQQEQADPEKRASNSASSRKDIGGGKAEFS